VIDKNGELLEAVHGHAEGVVTVTVPGPPPLASKALVDEREYVQAMPFSVIVKVWPAIVKVSLSAVRPWFEVTR
jgi:hypothetical protein